MSVINNSQSQSANSKSAKTSGKPAKSIVILGLVVIAFSVIAVFQGATSVKLGLDLLGGTSVTLTPRATEGANVTPEAISQAVEIIRQRVNSIGVAESEVTAQGSGNNRQIVISVPGETGEEIVQLVGQTAELRFRQVLVEAAPNAVSISGDTQTVTLPNGVTPELSAKFSELDCTNQINLQGGTTESPDVAVVSCDRGGSAKFILAPAQVLGNMISEASAAIDQQGAAGWFVSLDFNGEGATKFGALTQAVTGLAAPQNQVAIVLDGLVVSAPRINEAITGGSAQITGSFNQQEASNLANVLKYGALPLAFDQGEVLQVSPTLGSDQLEAGLLAGLIGFILVFLYSLFYYKALGVVTILSLLVAAGIAYVSILLLGEWLGFTLTLAGIAGIIVAVGITADSFVVYFERLRDEVREGRSIRSAAETGWVKARRTIVVSDMVSMIAATLLYFFAVGGVRGFAFTLGLTTLIDLLVVFFFTHPLVSLMTRMKFFANGHKLSGFSQKSLGMKTRTINSDVTENSKG